MRFFHNARFVVGESVAGPSHTAKEIPNQDSFLFVQKRKYTLLVVSDGMGSKPFADIGSNAVCRAVEEEIGRFVHNKKSSLPLTELLQNIISRWKLIVQPHSPKECSATCLFVLATKHKILAARLGDGMICLLGKNQEKDLLLTERKGSSFSNATFALSDEQALSEFSVNIYDRTNFCGVILTTDGISSDMENGRELPFARDVFSELKKMHFWRRRKFLKNMMENWPVPHHTDDKTIVAVEF